MKRGQIFATGLMALLAAAIACGGAGARRRAGPPIAELEASGLVGAWWAEEVQFDCETLEEVTPEEPIGELAFESDGVFSVTWMPFETYRDYWGTYEIDAETGAIELHVEGGNHVPDDIDGSGFYAIDEQGRLVLSEMWLGTRFEGTGAAACGHRFNDLNADDSD